MSYPTHLNGHSYNDAFSIEIETELENGVIEYYYRFNIRDTVDLNDKRNINWPWDKSEPFSKYRYKLSGGSENNFIKYGYRIIFMPYRSDGSSYYVYMDAFRLYHENETIVEKVVTAATNTETNLQITGQLSGAGTTTNLNIEHGITMTQGSGNSDSSVSIDKSNGVNIQNTNLAITGGDMTLTNGDFYLNNIDLSLNGNIEISGNDTFVITNQGYVGIGTSPKASLTVDRDFCIMANTNSWTNNSEGRGLYMRFDAGTDKGWIDCVDWSNDARKVFNLNASQYNFYTGQAVFHAGHANASDKRIKTDISLVIDDTALNRVNALESKEYNYIDPERQKPMKTIGFIAQEVKEVVPNAVSLQTEYIPDEMRLITEPVWAQDANDNWLLDIPDLDMSGAFTGKAKFYVSNDPSRNDEVCKEVEIEPDKKTFVFDQSWNNVFFYGKEVSDFHTIDKNQIFALHHGAIQELSRRNDEKTTKIDTLETLNQQKDEKIVALEERITAIEKLLQEKNITNDGQKVNSIFKTV